MAVYRLLREGPAFEPEAVHALVLAYEDALRDLQLTDRNDPFTDIVAKAVIEVTRLGERDPAEIRNRVLKVLTKPEEPGAPKARCVEVESKHQIVIASEAKQSRGHDTGLWIASALRASQWRVLETCPNFDFITLLMIASLRARRWEPPPGSVGVPQGEVQFVGLGVQLGRKPPKLFLGE
jgi:hypothetical protein